MYKVCLAALLIGFNTACSTVQPSKTVDFQVRWVRPAGKAVNWQYRHAERCAPYVDDELVIQGNGIDGVSGFSRQTGDRKWFVRVKQGVESGVAVSGANAFFGGSDGQFYSVNKNNGAVNWTFPTRAENLAAPLVEDGVVYFLSGNNVLYSLDAKTGKQLWSYNREEVSSLSIRGGSRPTFYKGTIYVGFSDGFLVALNSKDGSLLWERKLTSNPKFMDVDATPIVNDKSIWVSSFDGALYALSRTDGQIQWRFDEGGATAVTIDGDRIYYGSSNQNVYALNKDSGQVLWKYTLTDGVPTQPTLDQGVVFVGSSENDLIALDQKTGNRLGSYRPGAGVFATPIIDKKTQEVFVYSNGANLHVLRYGFSNSFAHKKF